MNDLIKNYRMIIAYDGTAYQGWQIQTNGSSIQDLLQKALCVLLRQETSVTGSGRTDAGVHARGQVAHFKYQMKSEAQELDLYRLLASINGLLPYDIRVKKIEEAPANFHSRYSAVSKIYHYHLILGPTADPFHRLYSWHVRWKIDRDTLLKAKELLIGTHDFTSFANEAHRGAAAKDAVRTLMRLDIIEQEHGLRFEFEANGFLYKMVRNIVGTLIEVSSGRIPLEAIPKILEAKNRDIAPAAAPSSGLFLMEVKY